VSRKEKLLASIRGNPKAVRFEDACKAAELIGFLFHGGEGSHRVYKRPDEPVILNFQNRKGLLAEYQAKQLIQMIDKYGEWA
jgi:predicted RNA binding protein YcfA (HicA-like mRNA interferase family)